MFNTKVNRTSYGNYQPISARQIAEDNANYKAYKEAVAQNQKAKTLNESYAKQRAYEDKMMENMTIDNMYIAASESYNKNMPEIVLREYFNKLVIESLYLDDYFVTEQAGTFKAVTHAYIKKLGGMQYLKEQIDSSGSAYLSRLYAACMESGKKIAEKKIKKAKKAKEEKDINSLKIDFSIDEDDKKDIDKKIETLDVDELSDMVKSKVLQIVQDESDISQKDSETVQELSELSKKADVDPQENPDQSSSEDKGDEPKDLGKAATENANKFIVGPTITQRSIFRSFVTKGYSDRIKGVTEGSSSTDTLSANIINNPLNLNVYDIYLQDMNEDLGYIDFVKNTDTPPIAGDDTEIDNDEILAEAIASYTILECAHTIKLISPSEKQISDMVRYNSK